MTTSVASWGFIGLGEMGEPMLGRLLAAAIPVTAFDIDPHRVALAAEMGAHPAPTVAELAGRCDVLGVCVRDGAQLDDVVGAILECPDPSGLTVVIHSTVGPAACQQVEASLAERDVAVVDAPVSGMRLAAETGSLTFFVGGPPTAVARVRPGLEAMGSTILEAGPVGSGQVVKLANNLVAFGTVGIVREALEIARSAGLEPAPLLEALSRGTARSWVVDHWGFLTTEWAASQPGGAPAVADIVTKDLLVAIRTAEHLGIEAAYARLAATSVPAYLGDES